MTVNVQGEKAALNTRFSFKPVFTHRAFVHNQPALQFNIEEMKTVIVVLLLYCTNEMVNKL
jgi:hypothetical protein